MQVLKVGKDIFKMSISKALSIARAGDIIKLAAGKYHITTVMNHAIAFEPEIADSSVVISGSLTINNTSCTFKNIKLECSVSDQSLITANQSNITFEHCSFYGNQSERARAVFLTESNLTVSYCSFLNISSNAIKAIKSSKIMISQSIFKDLKDSSAIYMESSCLDIQNSRFIAVATNAINAIGNSHIKAHNCAWQLTQAPALYLNPKVSAEITNSIFDGSITAIFTQQAALILKSCDFTNRAKTSRPTPQPSSELTITDNLFIDMVQTSVIKLESSQLDMQDSRFIDVAITAITASGQTNINARDCKWQMTQAPALFLHSEVTAEIISSIFKGNNATILAQQATLTLTSCEFMSVTDTSTIKVKKSSQLTVTDCLFKDMAHFAVIEIESSQLEITGSLFMDIATTAILASGQSNINARACTWQVTQASALLLHPKVSAEIASSTFKGSNATIVTQQATLTLTSCEFIDISASNPVEATQNSQVTIDHCRFENIQNFYAVYAEANSNIKVTDSRFNGNPFIGYSSSQSKIEFISDLILDDSEYSEADGGDVLFLNNDFVDSAELTFDDDQHIDTNANKSNDDLLNRNLAIEECLQELDGLIGLNNVKEDIRTIIAAVNFQQQRQKQGIASSRVSMHLIFTGNAGTGKSTVARIVSKIYNKLGLLATDHMVEIDSADLLGDYIGKTPSKILAKITQTMNGVLFINDAYHLVQDDNELGRDTIDILLQQIEDSDGRVAVILDGHTAPMTKFIQSYPNLKTCFTRHIEFEDLSAIELMLIFEQICQQGKIEVAAAAQLKVKKVIDALHTNRGDDFGNGAEIRTLFDKIYEGLSCRVLNQNLSDTKSIKETLDCIEEEDVDFAIKEMNIKIASRETDRENLLAQGLKELDGLVGLNSVKLEIKKLLDFIYTQKRRKESGLPTSPLNLHLIFTGNSGTGKTTVAKIIGKIYCGLGLLNTTQVIETDKAELVSDHIGQTTLNTVAKITEAMDGILFIDHAYRLLDGSGDFGPETIDILLKQMEDNRYRLVIIAAGHTLPMQNFIKSNPELAARFTRFIEFEDYNPDDLLNIFESLSQTFPYRLTDVARRKVKFALGTFYQERDDSFNNGHLVKRFFEKTVDLHAKRLALGLSECLDVFEVDDIPDNID